MRFDLHVHTNLSDGIYPPRDVLDRAHEADLRYLSITDHDNFQGYTQASDLLAQDPELSISMTLIPGVEVSCIQDGRDVHMLAYYIEHPVAELLSTLDSARDGRKKRCLRLIHLLESDGYPISLEGFLDSGVTINRTNIARILIREGCIENVDYFFDKMVGKGCPYHVPRHEVDPFTAVELIRASGGLPIIAHPALYGVVDLIEPLSEAGLAGVEAYHASQSLQTAHELQDLAESLDLLVTGGSDWHGDATHAAALGASQLPLECLEKFLAADPRSD